MWQEGKGPGHESDLESLTILCVCPFLPFSYYPRSMTPRFEIALLIPLFLSRWIINIECNTGYLYIYIYV